MNPQIPDQHSANVSTGIDTFVNHKWDNIPVPAKRLKIPRNVTNITKLGNVYAVPGEQALSEDELQEAASGSDTFVNHKWDKIPVPAKRLKYLVM